MCREKLAKDDADGKAYYYLLGNHLDGQAMTPINYVESTAKCKVFGI